MFLWCGKVSPWTADTRQQVKHFKSSMITVIANLTHIISRLLPELGFVLVNHQCRMYDNCKSRPEKILDVRNIERNTGRKIHISPEKIKVSINDTERNSLPEMKGKTNCWQKLTPTNCIFLENMLLGFCRILQQ